jgi:WD40 repeat protein
MNESKVKRTIRIFISSPGDVAEERDRARQVIDGLRRRYATRFLLKPVLWEDLALQINLSFQQGIDLVLSAERGIDVAIFILWSRLGSAVGPLVQKDDGGEYRSGTERELDLMLQAREQSLGLRPSILAYIRNDETCFVERLRGKPTSEQEDLIAQKKLVESFIGERFRDQVGGYNTRAFHAFDRPTKFADRLRTHLIELLDEIVGETSEVLWDIGQQGPPYLGLNSFQPQHADIFFGREEETQKVRFALREQAKAGSAFLLLTGASGSGKSSLARSGVLPDIIHNELDDRLVGWRSLIVTPGELAPDPIPALLRRLATKEILPDLRADETSLERLARGLRENPELAFELGLQRVFDDLGERAGGQVRLLLVLDQLEEVFATHVMIAEDRVSFLRMIEVFARSGSVWVLATARSDFFHQIQAEPSLVNLLAERGPMPLNPPGPDALQQLIEEPARIAGLKFEERDGVSLAKLIFREALPHKEVLPLLEFVLQELFEKSSPTDRLLTYAAYKELGGIEEAIGKQAEVLFMSLPEGSQAVLDEILPLLVTVEVSGEQSAVRRRARLDELRSTPEREMLTDSLIKKRFLATDRQDQESVASLTHEALLRCWGRIAQWVKVNHEHLRIRSRVLAAMTNWEKYNKRGDLLLSAGKPLDEAHELTSSKIALEPAVLDFIALSAARARRNHRIRRLAVASLVMLTILSIMASGIAWEAMRRAGKREEDALTSEQAAVASEQAALASRQATLASEKALKQQVYDNSISIAEREINMNEDIGKASMLLAGEDCPAEYRGWEWHYLMRLRDGERAPLKGHTTGLWAAEYSPDGCLIATCSIDGTIKIWDAATNRLLRTIEADLIKGTTELLALMKMPRIPIMCLAFSPDGKTLASGSFLPRAKFSLRDPMPKPDRDSPGLVRIWDVASGDLVASFEDQKGVALSLVFSPDGKRIASSSINPENSFVVWDVKTRKVIKRVTGHNSQIHRLRFSPDGRKIASGETDGVVKVWDAATFQQLHSIKAHAAPVVGISFLPSDGSRFATSGEDGLIRVWRTETGTNLLEMVGHAGSVNDVRYSPDGKRIASGGFDKTVRLWDANNGKPKITLRGHKDLVWTVAFSPDGQQIVSSSFDSTARIWDASRRQSEYQVGEFVANGHTDRVNSVATNKDSEKFVSGGWDKDIRVWETRTGKPLAVLQGHRAAIWCVALSPDGRKVVSASWDHTARVWDIATGRTLVDFTDHTAPVHSVAFSPDGKRIASGGFDGQLKIWDATTGVVIVNVDGFVFPVMSVAFSPDGQYVASAGADKAVKIWDAKTGKAILSLTGHKASIHNLAYSPDGTRVATASWDRTARVWDVTLGAGAPPERLLRTIDQHEDRVNAVAFSPDGKHLATASEDKTVRVWDVLSGVEVAQERRHRAMVWSITFLGDGPRLLSASWEDPSWIRSWKISK